MPTKITSISVRDIRFPTSEGLHGSDAFHKDPDYSCPYVTIETDVAGLTGNGIAFTLGRGNEVCAAMIEVMKDIVVGRTLEDIIADMRSFWFELANDGQFRWLGPEKGVVHFGVGALVNAVWDLYARKENKPLWQLLAEMSPEALVDCVEFRYISDALTPDEALSILREHAATRAARAEELAGIGLPSYTSSAGWLGYSDDQVRDLVRTYMAAGWTRFKMKIGVDVDAEVRRAALIREEIGADGALMVDANQVWGVEQAIEYMQHIAPLDPRWIEEPTHPDDILGHAAIAKAVAPIGVAVGECISNAVQHKQFMQAGAMSFCQIDSCRLGGINEVLAVLLMAAKFGIPVCPHAGGVGLCEHVQHLAAFNYVAVSPSLDDVMIEYSDHLHEHFIDPVVMRDGRYQLPSQPGYSITMKPASLDDFEFPQGAEWQKRQ
ncbi:MAG TPA: fuconate dehydratase [Lentisphaeria bacterium]|nr:fuconate dehydratase [Lentisphaeria bacterium]|tara:strand:- start:4538 stop:5842 length:1305 start_codon:yes stop_codon:yes gene_type:complete